MGIGLEGGQTHVITVLTPNLDDRSAGVRDVLIGGLVRVFFILLSFCRICGPRCWSHACCKQVKTLETRTHSE